MYFLCELLHAGALVCDPHTYTRRNKDACRFLSTPNLETALALACHFMYTHSRTCDVGSSPYFVERRTSADTVGPATFIFVVELLVFHHNPNHPPPALPLPARGCAHISRRNDVSPAFTYPVACFCLTPVYRTGSRKDHSVPSLALYAPPPPLTTDRCLISLAAWCLGSTARPRGKRRFAR